MPPSFHPDRPPSFDPDRPPSGATVTWVAVGRYSTRTVAQFAASILEGNGFDVRVVGDDAGGVIPHLDALAGGVQVQVPAEDRDDAVSLLVDLEQPPSPQTGLGRSRWRTIVMVLLAVVVLATVATAFLTGPSLLDL